MTRQYQPRQLTSARALAAHVLQQVHFRQRSLNDLLPLYASQLEAGEQALFKQLCFGSLRWYILLDAQLKQHLQKPIKSRENIIHYLLICGLYQLQYLDKPAYAVVQQTVDALQQLKRPWAKGLVNGVLRQFLRKQPNSQKQVSHYIASAHPGWLYDQLIQDWGKTQAKALIAANNQPAPLWLRVNQLRTTVEDYQERLRQAAIDFQILDPALPAIRLQQASAVDDITGFRDGLVSVQDAAAQFAAGLLSVCAGDKVLDACAAPGGKTAHILESQPELGQLWAVDISAQRIEKIHHNIQRLQLQQNPVLQCVAADILEFARSHEPASFDKILLDAPCSATGVIRRHPDIKLLRKSRDIEALTHLQGKILNQLWPLLKPGGLMLYATCSVLRLENDLQISNFVAQKPDAILQPIHLPVGQAMSSGWQILTGHGDMDGFYYALIKKSANHEQ